MLHPSVYWRIGDEPMNMPTSSGRPVRWAISTIGRDVADGRPGGAVGAQPQLRLDDLPRQALDIADHVRTGAGQADVGGVDAETIDEVQNFDFLRDRRRPHRRRLQPVAKRLVVEHDALRLGRRADLVPVVDQGFEHLFLRAGGNGRRRGAGRRDGDEPQRRVAGGAMHHRPETVIDGQRRQPLLVPDDLRSDERMAGHARLPVESHAEHDDGEQEPQPQRPPRGAR